MEFAAHRRARSRAQLKDVDRRVERTVLTRPRGRRRWPAIDFRRRLLVIRRRPASSRRRRRALTHSNTSTTGGSASSMREIGGETVQDEIRRAPGAGVEIPPGAPCGARCAGRVHIGRYSPQGLARADGPRREWRQGAQADLRTSPSKWKNPASGSARQWPWARRWSIGNVVQNPAQLSVSCCASGWGVEPLNRFCHVGVSG